MSDYNYNSGFGRSFFDSLNAAMPTMGKTFYVAGSADPNYLMISEVFRGSDPEGLVRLYSTITLALAATVAGRGDIVLISPNFQTAPTLTELATAATNGVTMTVVGTSIGGNFLAQKAPATLPASTAGTLFTVTAPILLMNIQGEVTTVIQAQANAAKLKAVPTVGSAVDICATVDLNAAAVGTTFDITGALASAATLNANGVQIGQATSIVIPAGTIALNTAATSTGAMKWVARYIPLAPGAVMY